RIGRAITAHFRGCHLRAEAPLVQQGVGGPREDRQRDQELNFLARGEWSSIVHPGDLRVTGRTDELGLALSEREKGIKCQKREKGIKREKGVVLLFNQTSKSGDTPCL